MAGNSFLVVDADDFLRDALATLLRVVGLQVTAARTAEEAVTLARRDPPTAVILDDWLPDVRDQKVARGVLAQLKSHPDTRDVPIIVMTENASKTRRDRHWRPYNPDDVLIMPCQASDVREMLDKYGFEGRAVVPRMLPEKTA